MKNFFLFTTAAFILQQSIIAQEGWFEQTSGISEWLVSVHFTDNNTGWVAGENGTILKTTNSGLNWNSQTSGMSEWLVSVHFTDSNTGWVIGENTILKTTDGGTNWTAQTSGTTSNLFSVHFTDNNTGWVVGENGTILNTTDGGINWNSQTSGTSNSLWSVYFADQNTGWVVGRYGTILHTTNGGVTFIEEEVVDMIPTEYLLSQNYPNPFNPSTKISWQVPVGSWQTLKIYDVLGNEVATLVDEYKPAGIYEVEWNANSLSSGFYFYQIKTKNFIETKKIFLQK